MLAPGKWGLCIAPCSILGPQTVPGMGWVLSVGWLLREQMNACTHQDVSASGQPDTLPAPLQRGVRPELDVGKAGAASTLDKRENGAPDGGEGWSRPRK